MGQRGLIVLFELFSMKTHSSFYMYNQSDNKNNESIEVIY